MAQSASSISSMSNGSNNIVSSAAVATVDFSKPPWIQVPGVANFRDIGGYPLANGKGTVRKNLVFRSAEPYSRITDEGKSKIQQLGIKRFYDLRSEPELKRLGPEMAKVVEVEGVERCFVPVHRHEDYSPEALASRYEQYMTGNLHSAYRNIIINGDPTAYRTIFMHLLGPNPDPMLIHCTAGKDRTGIICAMILLLAGVDRKTIAEEYALTTAGLEEVRENIIQYLMKDKKSMAGGGRERAENMLSSKVETMYMFFEILDEAFGGVEGYLGEACGFSKEEIERIRRNVVVLEKEEGENGAPLAVKL